MKKMTAILVFCCFVCSLVAQHKTTIHFDKPYYFSGEYILYSFCDSELGSGEITARINFHDNARVIESYHITIRDGCSEGYIKTTYDIPSRLYQMTVHVFDQETFHPIELISSPIRIFNDGDISNLSTSTPPTSKADLAIEESAASQSGGEIQINVPIPGSLKEAVKRVSVSVRDQALYGPHLKTLHSQIHEEMPVLVSGIPFSGKRVYKGTPDMTSKLLFSLNADQLVFDGTEVNAEEVINLELTDFYDRQRISFLDYMQNDITVVPDAAWSPTTYDQALSIDSSIIEHLDIYREEKLINRLFQQIPLSPIRDTTIKTHTRMSPNYTLDVQEYDIRGTTVDIFKEIVTPLKFRSLGKGEHGGRVFYERNGLSKFYSRDPLFILGNHVTREGKHIAKFPLQEIGYFKIYSLYDSLASLSPIAFGGLVFVDMIDPNYTLPEEITLPSLSLQGLQIPVAYPITPGRVPDQPSIGPLAYWNPEAEHDNGKIYVPFPKSDVSTTYLVEAVLHLENGEFEVIRQLVRVGI